MVAITGQTREEIESALDGVEAVISLANAPRRYVLSGHPSELERAVDRLTVRSKAEHAAFDKGQAPRPRPLGVEWLAVSAPFHSPAMADALPLMHESMRRFAFETRPQDLVVPMLRFETGEVWTGEDLAASQSIHSVDWPATMRALLHLNRRISSMRVQVRAFPLCQHCVCVAMAFRSRRCNGVG